MSKLLVASLACLLLTPATSFAQGYSDTDHSDDPFALPEGAEAASDMNDLNDPFGNAEARDERGMGIGRGPSRVEELVNFQRQLAEKRSKLSLGSNVSASTQGSFTIVSDGDMQLLLDTRNGKSWLLSQQDGGMKWVEIAKADNDRGPFGIPPSNASAPSPDDAQWAVQKEIEIKKRYGEMMQNARNQSIQKTAYLQDIIRLRNERITSIEDQLKATQKQLKDSENQAVRYQNELSVLKKQLDDAKDATKILPEPTISETPAPAKNE